MIFDFENEAESIGTTAEICIVGGGVCGITLAVELARKGKKVLLLEAGGERYEARSQALYETELIGLPFEDTTVGRVRALGGTSLDWGGQILEIDEHIFQSRDWIRSDGWPFPKSELAQYYKRALTFEGLAAEQSFTDALNNLKSELADSNVELDASRFCPELNFNKIFNKELRYSKNISVVLHVNVCEVRLSEADNMVTAVRGRTLSGREALFCAQRFIFAVGGMETSRLFLQPRASGPYPWQRYNQVGKHFQDHTTANMATFTAQSATIAPQLYYYAKNGIKQHPKLKLNRHRQRELGILDAAGTVAPVYQQTDRLGSAFYTYRMLKKGKFNKVSLGELKNLFAAAPELLWHRFPMGNRLRPPGKPTGYELVVHTEQTPNSSSSISIGNKTDALGMYMARIDWKLDELEVKTFREFTREIDIALSDAGYFGLRPDNSLMVDDSQLLGKVKGSHHHIGGARMALTPRLGVVDRDLLVMGVTNCYICSTAVFPTAGFVNPTHTLLALAFRLADRIT